MGKNWQQRWTDTINYLNTKFPCNGLTQRLGDHLQSVVPQGSRAAISKELSLGRRSDGEDDPQYGAATDQRHALRGLLLCQRVYFSDLWAKVNGAPMSCLPPTWKAESQHYWGAKIEHEILGGIGMFAPEAGATRLELKKAAWASPPSGKQALPGHLTLSRNSDTCEGAAETCYNGITAWLLKSGLASLRWFLQDWAPNGQVACDRLFGQGDVVWKPETPFKPDSNVPKIDAGYIIHMWNLENYNWNGHWVVSNGDGTVCGVNNGEVNTKEEKVLKKYTNNATLKNQFLGYGGLQCKQVMNKKGFLEEVPFDPPRWNKACMVRVDPQQIPNLI